MELKSQKKQGKRELSSVRRFSEQIKRQTVRDIELGKCTVLEAARELLVSANSIYKWVYKYSGYLQKNKVLIVEDQSEVYKTKLLEKKLQEAEAALGRKQMELDFLNKLIELAGTELRMDLKKNFSSHVSSGTGSTRESNTGLS